MATTGDILNGNKWHIHHGDCIEHMAVMPDACIDFVVFSPPFPSLFAYTDKAEDIGNTSDVNNEGKIHLSFFYKQLRRIVKSGRVVVVHVMQIPMMKRAGEVRTTDFRGMNIRLGDRAGLLYQYDWLVTKNPQSQAIRTHSHDLLFVTLERDRVQSRGAFGDYLIKFLIPGENAVPIDSPCITRNEWIKWAEACWDWHDIRETDTLNTAVAKGKNDTKHICPLQREVIRRLVKLYTNPGEIVFSPFAGIGSEGFESIKLERRFYGCEIKDEYVAAATKNLRKAEKQVAFDSRTLFDDVAVDSALDIRRHCEQGATAVGIAKIES